MISHRLLSAVALSLPALDVSPAAATSFVPMTDEALVDQAPAAAVVHIEAVDTGAAWITEYRVRVEQRLKGELSGTLLRVRVRVLGGSGPDGLSLHIYGAPRFA